MITGNEELNENFFYSFETGILVLQYGSPIKDHT